MWYNILLAIIISLGVIALLVYIGITISKKLNKAGTCNFVQYSPVDGSGGVTGYIMAGYIGCSGGGASWKPTSITVTNNGPGVFYIGPLQGQSSLYELDEGKSVVADVSQILPNVYYDSASQYKVPNFTII